MSQPCTQGERIAKVETKQDAIMERLEKLETKQDETLAAIHEIKNQLTSMCGTFVNREEFDAQKKDVTDLTKDFSNQKSFVKGIAWVLGTFGATLLAMVIAFAKIIAKVL